MKRNNVFYTGRVKDIYISPIKAILSELEDTTVDFIICTMNEAYLKLHGENILTLEFLDTQMKGHPHCFNKEHAAEIMRFLNRTEHNRELFVCCDSGESRSAAIAAALELHNGRSNTYIFDSPEYHPNPLVYQIMCDELGTKS